MKRLFFVLFFMFVSSAIFSDDTGKQYTCSFQIKPFVYLGALLGNGFSIENGSESLFIPIDIEFKYRITNKLNLFINPNLWISLGNHTNIDFNLIGGIIYRPSNTGLKGWYINLNGIVGYTDMTYEGRYYEVQYIDYSYFYVDRYESEQQKYLNIGYMLETGYEWVFNNGFALTLGGGIVKVYPIALENYKLDNAWPGGYTYGLSLYKLPFEMRMRVSLGYSF